MGLQGAQPKVIDVLLCPTRIHHHNVRALADPTVQLRGRITWSTLAHRGISRIAGEFMTYLPSWQ
jgi:hypothetical protein